MKLLLLLIGFLSTSFLSYSQDNLFLINNWGTAGITQIQGINPNDASGGTATTYAIGDGNTSSAAMAMSVNGKYLYYVPQVADNQGELDVFSIPAYPHPDFGVEPATGAIQSPTGGPNWWDVNGAANTSAVFFRRLGIAPDGWAYMMQTQDGDGEIYLSRFLTHDDGTASDFQRLGTVTLDGVAKAPNFFNGDLVLDGNGNMYILVNEDAAPNATSIYFLPAATLALATSSPSESYVTNIVTKYVVLDEGGQNFNSPVVGLALSSTGTFYVAVQSATEGGIYYINSGVQDGTVTIKGPGSVQNADNVADLATNYFPTTTVLPVTFGTLTAKISSASLIVNWSTLTETNNSYFEVQASADGNNFSKIGEVNSKGINGNSDQPIYYDFTKSVDPAVGLLGLSLLSLGFILLFINRRNKILVTAVFVIGTSLTVASCTKGSDQIDISGNGKLLIKIVQVDKDGKRSASQVVTAIRED